MRKTSNRQIQYNVENFDKIHASSASVRNKSGPEIIKSGPEIIKSGPEIIKSGP